MEETAEESLKAQEICERREYTLYTVFEACPLYCSKKKICMKQNPQSSLSVHMCMYSIDLCVPYVIDWCLKKHEKDWKNFFFL